MLVRNCYFIFAQVRLSDGVTLSRLGNKAFVLQYCVAAQMEGIARERTYSFHKITEACLVRVRDGAYHAARDNVATLASISIGFAIDQHG